MAVHYWSVVYLSSYTVLIKYNYLDHFAGKIHEKLEYLLLPDTPKSTW